MPSKASSNIEDILPALELLVCKLIETNTACASSAQYSPSAASEFASRANSWTERLEGLKKRRAERKVSDFFFIVVVVVAKTMHFVQPRSLRFRGLFNRTSLTHARRLINISLLNVLHAAAQTALLPFSIIVCPSVSRISWITGTTPEVRFLPSNYRWHIITPDVFQNMRISLTAFFPFCQ